jgi:hypothetical protein
LRAGRVVGVGGRFFAAPPVGDGLDDYFVNLSVESPDDGHRLSFPSARVCGYILRESFLTESLRPC